MFVVALVQDDRPATLPGSEGVWSVSVAGMWVGDLQYCGPRAATQHWDDEPDPTRHDSAVRLAAPALQQAGHQRGECVEPRRTALAFARDRGLDELGRHDDHPAQATSLT